MIVKHRGQEVLKEDLLHISNNYILTNHAKERIEARNKSINIQEAIRNPLLAYFNTDGSINVAITPYEYFVIATDEFPYKIITYKEQSWYGINIYEKQQMARNGFKRNVKRCKNLVENSTPIHYNTYVK